MSAGPLGNERCELATCSFGGPANSASPVALRPPLAEGLPLSLAVDLRYLSSLGGSEAEPEKLQPHRDPMATAVQWEFWLHGLLTSRFSPPR